MSVRRMNDASGSESSSVTVPFSAVWRYVAKGKLDFQAKQALRGGLTSTGTMPVLSGANSLFAPFRCRNI
jgi:hypothetical protein